MNFCDNMSQLDDIGVKCNIPDGFESVGYIVKRKEIDLSAINYGGSLAKGPSATAVSLPSTIISAFALTSGSKAYKISQLKNAFTDTGTSMEAGDRRNTFTNTLAFDIFDQGPKVAAIVNGLANGEFVVILEQKDKSIDAYSFASGESKWRVFGIENGLTASELTNNAYDDTIGNGWSVKMEEKASSSSAYYIFKDDLTTTDELIASLY